VSGTVDLDISALPVGVTGRLIFRLVNNDQDFGTVFHIQVRHRPTAVGDDYVTDEDTPLVIGAAGVLANDTDIDGGALSAVLVGGPSHGTLTLNSNGSFTYTPAADYNGTDTFTYKANDGITNSVQPATVTITVAPVNDAPVAANDT